MGSEAKAGQEHLHLFRRCILRLVQDNVGIVQGAAAHIGKRRDLDQSLFHICLEFLRAHDLIEGIVERAQIGVDLALQIAGQKAQFLTGFNSGTRQDDPLHFTVHKSRDRHGHGQEGLAGSCRAVGKDDQIITDRIDIFLLSHRLGAHRLSAHSVADDIAVHLLQHAGLRVILHFQRVVHLLGSDLGTVFRQSRHIL